MKKILLLVIVHALCVTVTIAQNGRENWFPNKGNVGIGIRNPPDYSLHIVGNLKVTEEIEGKSLNAETFVKATDLSIKNIAFIEGKLGIGVQVPTEKLDILGNAKISGTVFSNAINTQSLTTTNGSFTTLTVSQKSILNGKVGIGQSNPSESLDVLGNAKLSGSLTASNGSFSQGLTAGNTSIAGTFQVNGIANTQALTTTTLHTTGAITADQNLNVTGAATLNELKVNGVLDAQDLKVLSLSTSDIAKVGKDLTVLGTTKLINDLTVSGNSIMTGNVTVNGTLNAASLSFSDVNATGNANIAKNLDVLGTTHLGGDLTINGNLKTGIIEATEFRTIAGGSPFNFENAIISKTLAIATDKAVPSNYKMAVGGNIIATGIDIKVPQKWPDYVFTDEHALLAIPEVAEYIKKNGHLPNVLSAEQMKAQQNYSVSEMDAKLLEKIEELMLYVIELRKEIDSLKKK